MLVYVRFGHVKRLYGGRLIKRMYRGEDIGIVSRETEEKVRVGKECELC